MHLSQKIAHLEQEFDRLCGHYASTCPELTSYSLHFNHSRRQLGVCDYRRRQIRLSLPILNDNALAVQMDTLLHEVAHALAFHLHHERGHGRPWKHWANLLGAVPNARCDAPLKIAYKYQLVLFKAGKLTPLERGYHKKVSLKNRHLKGQKDTLNCLYLIPCEQLQAYQAGHINLNQVNLFQ